MPKFVNRIRKFWIGMTKYFEISRLESIVRRIDNMILRINSVLAWEDDFEMPSLPDRAEIRRDYNILYKEVKKLAPDNLIFGDKGKDAVVRLIEKNENQNVGILSKIKLDLSRLKNLVIELYDNYNREEKKLSEEFAKKYQKLAFWGPTIAGVVLIVIALIPFFLYLDGIIGDEPEKEWPFIAKVCLMIGYVLSFSWFGATFLFYGLTGQALRYHMPRSISVGAWMSRESPTQTTQPQSVSPSLRSAPESDTPPADQSTPTEHGAPPSRDP